MPSIQELRDTLGGLGQQIENLRTEADGRAFSAEEQAKWDKLCADHDAAHEQLERQQQADAIKARTESATSTRATLPDRTFDGPVNETRENEVPEAESRNLAFDAWFRHQAGGELTASHVTAAQRHGINPSSRELVVNLGTDREARAAQTQFRAQSAYLGSTGGYTVPEGFSNELERRMLYFGPMLQVSRIIRTNSGNDIPWPTLDDTSNTGSNITENTTASDTDLTFSAKVLKAYKATSDFVKVPVELMEDSAFDLSSMLADILGERLGRRMNAKLTTGTGSGEATGIVTVASTGKTTTSATAITADEIIDLEHSVDVAYRMNARFMLNDLILAYVRKLKGGDGQYLWQAMSNGAPPTLWGKPYSINNDMASTVATTNVTMLFGDFDKYVVRQVREIRFRRLIERFADADQEGFIAFIRFDGNLVDAGGGAIKALVQA